MTLYCKAHLTDSGDALVLEDEDSAFASENSAAIFASPAHFMHMPDVRASCWSPPPGLRFPLIHALGGRLELPSELTVHFAGGGTSGKQIYLARAVGQESQKTLLTKSYNGFFTKYMSGIGLDVGFGGYVDSVLPILPNAIGVGLDYPGYDGVCLPWADGSLDYVYSSHVLEHIADFVAVLQDWRRVLKVGGHLVIVVPSADLYEKKPVPPSIWNADHRRFYTPATLLQDLDRAFERQSFRVRHMRENDEGHDYGAPSSVHGSWLYEVEVVLQKL